MQPRIHNERYEIVTIAEVLAPAECAALIAFAEDIGFADAPVTTALGFKMIPEIRNNTRVMIDDHARAAALWHRLAPFVPVNPGAWKTPVGLNERFRFYRYEPGQRFAWHRDGAFERDNGECSKLTLMLYLNQEFVGGCTEFDVGEPLVVQPQTGMALLFAHGVRHQGAAVSRGRKYVLRTDVMYRR